MSQQSPSRNRGIRQTLAVVTAAMIAVASLPAVAYGQGGEANAITTGDPESDALIAQIEQVHTEMVQAREQLRSDRLDAEVLLDDIGRDPGGIRDWVATETRWLPYEGALRGASGVLMDRSGSSLDRALLLAELLQRVGLEVRLANTMLDASTASTLAAEVLEVLQPSDAEPMFASVDEVEAARASVAEAASDLAAEIGLLAEPTAATDTAALLADHWWVQAASPDGWVDYDPVFADDTGGRPPATRTFDPALLPEELHHTVTVRVVIERLEDGALVEEIPLEHVVVMGADAANSSMELGFADWVPAELADQADRTTDLLEGARLTASWRPRLQVGDETVRGQWFSTAGRIESPSAPPQADALSGGLDALSGLGAETAEESGPTMLTAAWIEYESSGPGTQSRTERRELLDLVGAGREDPDAIDGEALLGDAAATDRGLAFLGTTDVLLQSAAPHPDAFVDAYLEDWIELRPALIALVFLDAGVEDERIEPSLASPETQATDLLAMTVARRQWATSDATYVGRPQVWSRHAFFDASEGTATSGLAVDIVLNGVDVMADPGVEPRLVRLEQGLLDTLIEHELSTAPDGLNTWERWASDTGDDAWTVLPPGTDPSALTDALPSTDLARMRSALEQGETVVVAPDPRSRGDEAFADWWRIAPDGTALGIGYRGWGQDTTEEASITQEISLKALKPLLDQDRTVRTLRTMEATARRARLSGAIDPYAHLSVFADTQPIIVALARTLPFITSLGS